jgi:hypothetical protein
MRLDNVALPKVTSLMSEGSKRQRALRAFLSYLVTYLVGLTISVCLIELVWLPVVAWLKGYPGYYWPSMSRVYADCKLVPLASLICAVGTWIYDRRRIGW